MKRSITIISHLLSVSILFGVSGCSKGSDQITHEGTTYWIYRLDPSKETLRLLLSEKPGKPNKFSEVQARIKAEGKELKFALNAGIFEPDFRSSGLHVSEGKTVGQLNLDDYVKKKEGEFTPNFYLKPNGVFYLLEDNSVGIVESSKMTAMRLASPIRIANQSGPLLAFGKKIHPVLTKDGTSKRHRNGVGVTPEGQIVLACSVEHPQKGLSNLYNFATLFTEKLNCPDALYLDGDISYIYWKGKTPAIKDTNWFGGIFAIAE